MSNDDFHRLVLQRIDEIKEEQKLQRAEVRQELIDLKIKFEDIASRLIHVEWKLKLQQSGLYAISAAIGAALWKVPALVSWIKEHMP